MQPIWFLGIHCLEWMFSEMHFLVFLQWVFSGRLVLRNVSFLPIGFLEERFFFCSDCRSSSWHGRSTDLELLESR